MNNVITKAAEAMVGEYKAKLSDVKGRRAYWTDKARYYQEESDKAEQKAKDLDNQAVRLQETIDNITAALESTKPALA